MTTEHKAQAILERILEIVNSGKRVILEEDFGGNTLTIYIDNAHTHIGVPGGTFNTLLEGLSNSLNNGPGLSWYDPTIQTDDTPS